MPLVAEAIDAGLFSVSEATRRFFLDWRAALYAKDYTPMEDRPGAADAIAELKSLFDDDFTCQRFKDRLYEMGAFGCARSRRLKAIAAILGLKDKNIEDCLAEPKQDQEPRVYYLPPEDATITYASLQEPAETTDDGAFCPAPPGATTAEDALCPTDTHQGCNEPDPEGTADLEDPSDCDTAINVLRAIGDLFPELPPGALIDRTDQEGIIVEAGTPPQIPEQFPTQEEEQRVQEIPPSLTQAFPLYSPRTYLDALYKTINIHDHPALSKCTEVKDIAEATIERINNVLISLPRGYINPDLLPKGFELPLPRLKREPSEHYAGLSDDAARRAKRTASSARRYHANQRGT